MPKISTRLFAAFLFSWLLALAQSGNSSISGSISDASGQVLPAAQVRVLNLNTGVRLSTVTNESGLYRVNALLPGAYQIEVEAAGFDRLSRGPVTVEVSQSLAVDLTLQVGKQTETVTVTEGAPLVESQTSSVAQVVSRAMLEGLPLPNRAASSLAALAPGVVMI